MSRLRHGEAPPSRPAAIDAPGQNKRFQALGVGPLIPDYKFMFPTLAADPEKRLPETPDMGRKLFALASIMTAVHANPPTTDSGIPAGFTYFGQFIDHDITLEQIAVDGENLPLSIQPLADPQSQLRNLRDCALDLDSVYADPAPRDLANPAKLRLGRVSTAPPRPPGRDPFNDLPRQPRSVDPREDRAALTGDPRNDENLIVAQLHVAFLRAHNALVDETGTEEEARSRLRKMYQSAVLGDFLARLADPTVFRHVMTAGPRILAGADFPFVPLEFAVAAFRFGHSMVRAEYDINASFGLTGKLGRAPLSDMFMLTALSGNFAQSSTAGFDTLPENWLVEWRRLLPIPGAPPPLMANRIDTTLSPGLDDLRDELGNRLAEPVAVRLAARNLLRGFRLGLPTGQAVATALGFEPLTGDNFLAALPTAQQTLVRDLGFHDRTPLWFYILAEAGDARVGAPNGTRLGPVGSTIVCETLYMLARQSPDNIIPAEGGQLDTQWKLVDILQKARVT